MNMFDEAITIDGMIKMLGVTQTEIAKQLGVSQSYVANKIRLLNIPERLRALIVLGGLSERHARTLLRIKDEGKLEECINRATERRMTVAECEAMVDIELEARAPNIIGRAPKNERIDCFIKFLSSSIESLRSLGIEVNRAYSHHGRHSYITISIEDI